MSNRAMIIPTRFEDVRTGSVSYGVRIQDDYAMTYDNSWDSIPDDDLEVLKRALAGADEAADGILTTVAENERGCYVDATWYTWDQIKHLWETDQ